MMVKLRDAVEIVNDEKGAIFRIADKYLPLNGHGISSVISVLTPFLDGSFTEDEVCIRMGEANRSAIKEIISALRDAGMLYNWDRDRGRRTIDSDSFPDELLRRVEWRGEEPDKHLRAFMDTKVLLLGSPHLIRPLLEAGVALGIRHQDFIVVNSGSESVVGPAATALVQIAEGHKRDVRELTIEEIRGLKASNEGHNFIVVASASSATTEACEGILLASGYEYVPFAPLLQCSYSILVGPLVGNTTSTCLQDIIDRFGETMLQAEHQDFSVLATPVIRLGAYILMQRIFDLRASITYEAEEFMLMHRVDLNTCEVTSHPYVQDGSSDPNPGITSIAVSPVLPYPGIQDPENTEALLSRVYRCLVDSRIGIMRCLEEGDLLQLPIHQSFATWCAPTPGREIFHTSEFGKDLAESRLSTARSSLEEYASIYFENQGRDSMRCDSNGPGGDDFDHSRAASGRSIVVSGTDDRAIKAEGFFKALAKQSNRLGRWKPISAHEVQVSCAGDSVFEYLTDLCLMNEVDVERSIDFAEVGCELIRLAFRKTIVTVIAGHPGDSVLRSVYRDLWLYTSANDAVRQSTVFTPKIRFRGLGGDIDELECLQAEVTDRLNLEFLYARLDNAALAWMKPYRFYQAVVFGDLFETASAATEKENLRIQSQASIRMFHDAKNYPRKQHRVSIEHHVH